MSIVQYKLVSVALQITVQVIALKFNLMLFQIRNNFLVKVEVPPSSEDGDCIRRNDYHFQHAVYDNMTLIQPS